MERFRAIFQGVENPRKSNAKKHDLNEMLMIALLATLAGQVATQPVPQFRMALARVPQAKLMSVAQAMQVEPIARDVQANDLRMWQSVHSLFLLIRGP